MLLIPPLELRCLFVAALLGMVGTRGAAADTAPPVDGTTGQELAVLRAR